MTRRRRRMIVLIVILLVLLACLGVWFVNYSATRSLNPLTGVAGTTNEAILPPQYMFSFSGTEAERLDRPVGVFVDDETDTVYVTDSRQARIFRFTSEGDFIDTFGFGDVVVPLYIDRSPIDGNLYVTDRRLRGVKIFDLEGNFIGDFEPNLPEDQQPLIETEREWAPVALEFGDDGRLYVTEILRGHRLLVFSPEGEFMTSVGDSGVVTDAEAAPEIFQFPNGIAIDGGEVWIADSNNRRMQVFDLDGTFDRIVATEGLPRGADFLNTPELSEDETVPPRFVVVDTLAHDATIWNAPQGEKVVVFGTNGVLEGQFSYPNDVFVDDSNRMYITDTANARVQVWGWPQDVAPIPLPSLPQRWGYCLTPLLLLPLLLFWRKKRFFATKDFVDAMMDAEKAQAMPHRRRRWWATPDDYELIKEYVQDDVRMAELFEDSEWSDSDVRDLMERLEVDETTAIILAIAQRARVFCTQDFELRRLAKVLGLDVVDRDEFLDRFENDKVDADEEPETQEGIGNLNESE